MIQSIHSTIGRLRNEFAETRVTLIVSMGSRNSFIQVCRKVWFVNIPTRCELCIIELHARQAEALVQRSYTV